jgi:GT2 family glycosyltransferase
VTSGASLIIVNFNAGEALMRCLEAVAAQTVLPERLLLIDNASTDGSLAKARELIASNHILAAITVISTHPKNLGFAAANNHAIAQCDTEFVALLNPDAIPHPDWLENLLAATHRHPTAASFGSLQMRDSAAKIVDGLGDFYHPAGICWRKRHGKVLRPRDLVEIETTSACAAAALYRRSAFLEAGGFDENFFCYVEDVDLGLRLRQRGHTAIFIPSAVVEHASENSRSNFAVYHGHRNIVWCFFKNTPPAMLPLLLIPHLLASFGAFAVCALRSQASVFLRAKADALRGLLRPASKFNDESRF